MNPILLAIFLLALGLIFIAAELALPAHGAAAATGAAAIGGAIVACFFIGPALGLASLVAAAIAGPVLAAGFLRLWPRTYLGSRLILHPPESSKPLPPVSIGMTGVAASDLRPSGVCDFGEVRVEAQSERGLIPAGQRVKVIDLVNDRPTVRALS